MLNINFELNVKFKFWISILNLIFKYKFWIQVSNFYFELEF